MEQGHDLSSSSSSGCAEQAARCPGTHRAVCSGEEKDQRLHLSWESTFRQQRAKGRSFQGGGGTGTEERAGPAAAARRARRGPGAVAGAAGRDQQAPPRDLVSLLPPHGPGRSRALPWSGQKAHGQAAAAAPCRGAQGSTCPPGSPGPRCGNQVRAGDPRLAGAPFCGDGLLHPLGLLCTAYSDDLGPGFTFI